MKKYFIFFLNVVSGAVHGQTTEWANSISCIFYTHCTSCHNPNGIAPFSLLTYTDAMSNASEIKSQVQSRKMPPFLADISYQQYAHQKTLSQHEIDLISDWVDNGAVPGDTTLALPAPSYSSVAVIQNPDFSASIGTYSIPNLGNDEYRCFVISNPSSADEFITGIEVIPGNRAAVHHVLIFSDDTNTPVQLDNADPDPGYLSFGGTGSAASKLIGGFVPGSDPYFLPPNMGMFVPAGSRIIIQVHYPISASGMTDSTRVNFSYSPGLVRPAYDAAPLDHLSTIVDGPLYIPANTVRTFHEEYTLPADVSVLSVAPHAHLVCTSMKSYAVKPGGDTIHFENIPHWDFHWQGAYYFQKPIYLPAGTVLFGEATYDNTVNNPENPNNPPQDVSLGESTTDEMMLFFFVYTAYLPGDENIVIDTTGHLPHYLNCITTTSVDEKEQLLNDVSVFPNPATDQLTLSGSNFSILSVAVFNLLGNQILSIDNASGNEMKMYTRSWTSGLYFLRVTNENGISVFKKILVSRK